MKAVALALLLASLGACGDDAFNPPKLWLYLEGGETDVKLVDAEPPEF